MPISPEVLNQIKEGLEKAEAEIKSQEDVINDLRASDIDASAQEERLKQLKAEWNKLRTFYNLQKDKVG